MIVFSLVLPEDPLVSLERSCHSSRSCHWGNHRSNLGQHWPLKLLQMIKTITGTDGSRPEDTLMTCTLRSQRKVFSSKHFITHRVLIGIKQRRLHSVSNFNSTSYKYFWSNTHYVLLLKFAQPWYSEGLYARWRWDYKVDWLFIREEFI